MYISEFNIHNFRQASDSTHTHKFPIRSRFDSKFRAQRSSLQVAGQVSEPVESLERRGGETLHGKLDWLENVRWDFGGARLGSRKSTYRGRREHRGSFRGYPEQKVWCGVLLTLVTSILSSLFA